MGQGSHAISPACQNRWTRKSSCVTARGLPPRGIACPPEGGGVGERYPLSCSGILTPSPPSPFSPPHSLPYPQYRPNRGTPPPGYRTDWGTPASHRPRTDWSTCLPLPYPSISPCPLPPDSGLQARLGYPPTLLERTKDSGPWGTPPPRTDTHLWNRKLPSYFVIQGIVRWRFFQKASYSSRNKLSTRIFSISTFIHF